MSNDNGLTLERLGELEIGVNRNTNTVLMRVPPYSLPAVSIEFTGAETLSAACFYTEAEALRVAAAIKALPGLIEIARRAASQEAISPEYLRKSAMKLRDDAAAILAQLEPQNTDAK